MFLDPRSILLFGANALLLYLTMLINSALVGWSIYFYSRPHAGLPCTLLAA